MKFLIIICCEVIIGSMGNTSYSYEAGYTNETKNYTVTIFTARKYEIGDTIGVFDRYPIIDWSDTTFLYNKGK